MRVDILTLFPDIFQGGLNESMLKKAQEKGLLSLNIVDLRTFTADKHKTADDSPYGGGAGMLMKADVIARAIDSARVEITPNTSVESHRVILMCPSGKTLDHAKVKELSVFDHITILCGRYEGVDERVRKMVDEEISIGDYVLTGGEIPAMVLVDAVARQIPGVVKEEDSVREDSFFAGLLDHPSYTRPEEFKGETVPEVLLSGNHKEINGWRRKEALKRTLLRRPDILAKAELNEEDKRCLERAFWEL